MRNDLTDDELRDAILIMRQRTARAGMMHALWDTILDAEALLAGRPTLLPREDVIRIVIKELEAK